MTEYESETSRLPRPRAPTILDRYRPASREIADYLSLEYPRETERWLLAPPTRRPEPPPQIRARPEPVPGAGDGAVG